MLIIAHRGASGEYPENTLLAFEEAIAQQADGIELDVQQHPCGDLLLLHNRFLDKYTSTTGHFSQHSTEHIQSASLTANHTVTTLEQALALIAGRCIVNIELKCASDDISEVSTLLNRLSTVITTAINLHGFSPSQFVLSSFNHVLLKHCEEQLPHIKRAALIACNPLDLSALVSSLPVSSVNPSIDCINHNLVKQAHQRGLEVWVYTVNQPFDIDICHQLGVDAIFTDFPARTRAILNQG